MPRPAGVIRLTCRRSRDLPRDGDGPGPGVREPLEYKIPPTGHRHQYFEVPTNFKKTDVDAGGRSAGGDPEHVHHIIVSVIRAGEEHASHVVSVRPIFAEGQATCNPGPQRTEGERTASVQTLRGARVRGITLVNLGRRRRCAGVRPARHTKDSGRTQRSSSRCTTRPMARRSKGGDPVEDRIDFAKEPPDAGGPDRDDCQSDVCAAAWCTEPQGRSRKQPSQTT